MQRYEMFRLGSGPGVLPPLVRPEPDRGVGYDVFFQPPGEFFRDLIGLRLCRRFEKELRAHGIIPSFWPFHVQVDDRVVEFGCQFLRAGENGSVLVQERGPIGIDGCSLVCYKGGGRDSSAGGDHVAQRLRHRGDAGAEAGAHANHHPLKIGVGERPVDDV